MVIKNLSSAACAQSFPFNPYDWPDYSSDKPNVKLLIILPVFRRLCNICYEHPVTQADNSVLVRIPTIENLSRVPERLTTALMRILIVPQVQLVASSEWWSSVKCVPRRGGPIQTLHVKHLNGRSRADSGSVPRVPGIVKCVRL